LIIFKTEKQHVWKRGGDLGLSSGSRLYRTLICAQCGVLQNINNIDRACKGRVKVALRDRQKISPESTKEFE